MMPEAVLFKTLVYFDGFPPRQFLFPRPISYSYTSTSPLSPLLHLPPLSSLAIPHSLLTNTIDLVTISTGSEAGIVFASMIEIFLLSPPPLWGIYFALAAANMTENISVL